MQRHGRRLRARAAREAVSRWMTGPASSSQRFGSPLYVYDLREVERRYLRFVQAFPYRPLECHYALVCNKNPVIVRRLHELGAGVHANTPGDAFAALAAGVPAEDVVYSGTNLTGADLDYLLALGVALNVDSLDQLRDVVRRGGCRSVGLRFLIDDPAKRNRIGVSPRELLEALLIADAGGVRVAGLHMYAGTNNHRRIALPRLRRPAACGGRDAPRPRVREPRRRLRDRVPRGGAGSRRRRDRAGGDAAAAVALASARARNPADPRAGPRPGRVRGLAADDGRLGEAPRRPALRRSGHHRREHRRAERLPRLPPAGGARRRAAETLELTTDVCGNTTHSGDFIARDVRLPRVEPGDVLALRDVGAYAYAMSSHFLNRPRPAEVVLDGGEAILTTRRETLDDLVALYEPGVLA